MQDWGLVPHHLILLVGGYMENGERASLSYTAAESD